MKARLVLEDGRVFRVEILDWDVDLVNYCETYDDMDHGYYCMCESCTYLQDLSCVGESVSLDEAEDEPGTLENWTQGYGTKDFMRMGNDGMMIISHITRKTDDEGRGVFLAKVLLAMKNELMRTAFGYQDIEKFYGDWLQTYWMPFVRGEEFAYEDLADWCQFVELTVNRLIITGKRQKPRWNILEERSHQRWEAVKTRHIASTAGLRTELQRAVGVVAAQAHW